MPCVALSFGVSCDADLTLKRPHNSGAIKFFTFSRCGFTKTTSAELKDIAPYRAVSLYVWSSR